MSKFKVGDKVVANAQANYHYMITREGWTGTVVKVYSDRVIVVKGLDRGGMLCEYDVNPEYFDLVVDRRKIVITTDGKKTVTAKLVDGKKTVKTAVAKCSPSDVFNFETGAEIAFGRLFEAEPEKPKLYNGKVVCIHVACNEGTYTVGKIYQFVDGKITADSGRKFGGWNGAFTSFEDFAKWTSSEFIEVVE